MPHFSDSITQTMAQHQLERVGRTDKSENKRKNHAKASLIRRETSQSLTENFRNNQKESKWKYPDLNTQKIRKQPKEKNPGKLEIVKRGGGMKVN